MASGAQQCASQTNDRHAPRKRRAQNPAYRRALHFFLSPLQRGGDIDAERAGCSAAARCVAAERYCAVACALSATRGISTPLGWRRASDAEEVLCGAVLRGDASDSARRDRAFRLRRSLPAAPGLVRRRAACASLRADTSASRSARRDCWSDCLVARDRADGAACHRPAGSIQGREGIQRKAATRARARPHRRECTAALAVNCATASGSPYQSRGTTVQPRRGPGAS